MPWRSDPRASTTDNGNWCPKISEGRSKKPVTAPAPAKITARGMTDLTGSLTLEYVAQYTTGGHRRQDRRPLTHTDQSV